MRTRRRILTQGEWDAALAAFETANRDREIKKAESLMEARERIRRSIDEHEWITRKPRASGKAWLFAERTGLTKRPCVCGARKVEMHHHDYSKPLEVAFLCRPCHRDIHNGKLKMQPDIHDLRDLAVESLVAFV